VVDSQSVCVCVQLIHIYSVPTNEVVAFSVTDGQLSSLLPMIHSQLHIDRSDQELLTPTGTVADLNADLAHYCLNQVSTTIYMNLFFY